MMLFIELFMNRIHRTLQKKEIFVLAFVIVPIVIFSAVLLSGRVGLKANIALVVPTSQEASPNSFASNGKFIISTVSKKPTTSEMLLGFYDATVERVGDVYVVTTEIKGTKDKKIIEDYFNRGVSPDGFESQEWNRGLGTKILGILVMILLMQGVALTMLYPEDRSLKTFGRILTSPATENLYIFVQGVFTFLWVSIPVYVALVMTKLVFRVEMGFSLEMLALLVAIVSFFATGFGLFFSSILKQNISLTASGIAILTSLVSGCLVEFSFHNSVWDFVLCLFPQREFMTIADGVEKGGSLTGFPGEIAYFLAWSVGLWILGSVIVQRKVKQGNY